MNFYEKIVELIKKENISNNKMLTDLGLGKNSMVDWKERGNVPNGETILKLAEYFNVSTDYLLGKTDDPTLIGERLNIPDELKDVKVAFNKGELEDLTQDEVDKLTEYVKFIKSQRKGK